jgi:prephenate dehydratase
VADIHSLLPESGLHIVGEAFVRVRIALLGLAGADLAGIREARSHPVLLGQCAGFLRRRGIRAALAADTAGAARRVAEGGDAAIGALASELAAETYGLDILASDIEDHGHNTTRFLLMSRTPARPALGSGPVKTTFVFRVRNIPAALYKAMGGFATNGVNMTKLESYMVEGAFTATQFYADIEGHPEDRAVRLALDELDYFTDHLKILGIYPADPDHYGG